MLKKKRKNIYIKIYILGVQISSVRSLKIAPAVVNDS